MSDARRVEDRAGAERRGFVGVGEFIHKRSSEGVNGCACERTSETASAFLLACRPAIGFPSVFLSPTGALFPVLLSRSFLLPVPPLFYSLSADYRRLYGPRQRFPSPRSCTECNDRSVGIYIAGAFVVFLLPDAFVVRSTTSIYAN